jgi:chromate reductase
MKSVAVLVGSLRKDSINLKFAKAIGALAHPRLQCELVSLADLPIYNDDLWQAPPAAVLNFKQQIERASAVLFVTPEYNRSIPPVLKNAIDWGSRPKGGNVWMNKPGAVVGASPGYLGAAVAQSHLRYVAGVVGIALLPLPEVYFSFKQHGIDAAAQFEKTETADFISDFIAKFDRWIARLTSE